MNRKLLLGLYVICMVFLVSATTPTGPTTITPADNTVVFNDYTNTLTCSGATHPDSKPLNVTFKQTKFTRDETGIHKLAGAGTFNTQTQAPFYMETQCGTQEDYAYMNLTFNSNIWVIDMDFKSRDCFKNFAGKRKF